MTKDRGHAMDCQWTTLWSFSSRIVRAACPRTLPGVGTTGAGHALLAWPPVSPLTLVNDFDNYCLNGTQDGDHGSGAACTGGSDSSSGS